jgi:hypothetical protein
VTTLGGGGAALARASLSSRRTSGSRNPIVADADIGVVGVVIVVHGRGDVMCAVMCRQRLLCRFSAHDGDLVVSAYSFGFPLRSRWNWPYCALLGSTASSSWVYAGVWRTCRALSPRSYPYPLQFRFPSRIQIQIQVQYNLLL